MWTGLFLTRHPTPGESIMQAYGWYQLVHGWLSLFKPLIQQPTNGGQGVESCVPVIHRAKIIEECLNLPGRLLLCICHVVVVSAGKRFLLVCANQLRALYLRGPREHLGEGLVVNQGPPALGDRIICSRTMGNENCKWSLMALPSVKSPGLISDLLHLVVLWKKTRYKRWVDENHNILTNFLPPPSTNDLDLWLIDFCFVLFLKVENCSKLFMIQLMFVTGLFIPVNLNKHHYIPSKDITSTGWYNQGKCLTPQLPLANTNQCNQLLVPINASAWNPNLNSMLSYEFLYLWEELKSLSRQFNREEKFFPERVSGTKCWKHNSAIFFKDFPFEFFIS